MTRRCGESGPLEGVQDTWGVSSVDPRPSFPPPCFPPSSQELPLCLSLSTYHKPNSRVHRQTVRQTDETVFMIINQHIRQRKAHGPAHGLRSARADDPRGEAGSAQPKVEGIELWGELCRAAALGCAIHCVYLSRPGPHSSRLNCTIRTDTHSQRYPSEARSWLVHQAGTFSVE